MADFLGEGGLVDASPEGHATYIAELRSAGKSIATVSRTISSIKCLYAHFFIKQLITINPAQGLTSEKVPQKLPEILTNREVELFFPAALNPGRHLPVNKRTWTKASLDSLKKSRGAFVVETTDRQIPKI